MKIKNPFNTQAFFKFAGIGNSSQKNKFGVVTQGIDCPLIVEKASIPCMAGEHHVVYTPICLSGPEIFDENKEIGKTENWVEGYNIAAGFIQTREKSDTGAVFSVSEDGNYTIYRDSRTNYRLQLGLSVSELIQAMKRDSRQRAKNIIKKKSFYRLEPCRTGFEDGVLNFAELYTALAKRQCFSSSYVFTVQDWMALLNSKLWTLYLLYYKSVLIAGTVVSMFSKGYDYTFMASDPTHRDASRALIIFLYDYLTENSTGYLDLGGGIAENDSLAKFKCGLGAKPVCFKRVKFVDNYLVQQFANQTCVTKAMVGRWPIQNSSQR